MSRTLLAALWMVPAFAVLSLVAFWFVYPLIASVIWFYRGLLRRRKRRPEGKMVAFDPGTRRYTYRRPPESR